MGPQELDRTIVVIDFVGFTNSGNLDMVAARRDMFEVLTTAFAESGIDFDSCDAEDRADSVLVLVPPTVSKGSVAAILPHRLATTLDRYNSARHSTAPMRLRVALYHGMVRNDGRAWTGRSIYLAFRMLEARPVQPQATDWTVMLIVSDHFYTTVIQNHQGTSPESYRQVTVPQRDFTGSAWIRLLGPSEDPSGIWKVRIRGFGDRPPSTDLLRRGATIGALADVISPSVSDDDHDRSGPTVIALDGSWGTGKTSLVELVQRQLATATPTTPAAPVPRLRVFEADRALAGRKTGVWNLDMLPRSDPTNDQPPLITSRFEPWAHQTSEQVWAGLTGTLLGAVESTLLPRGAPGTERYWFQRNLDRVDRMRLRRSLRKGVLSPLMAVSTLALAVPLVAQLARSTDTYHLAWVDIAGSNIAVLVTVTMLLAAIGHSLKRYLTRPAADFLPADLFVGPVPSGTDDEALRDPYHNAQSGYLYLAQHDVFAVLEDVEASGHHMVVFVDDLDRCTPRATAEVFEAINTFVVRTFPITRFVLCLDMITVAAHLDHVYADLKGKVLHGDDPTPGWSFLRKLIQLPVTIPHIATDNVGTLLDDLLATPVDEDIRPSSTPIFSSPTAAPMPVVRTEPEVTATAEMLEHNQQVRDRLAGRLQDQPALSVREAKRILTIWQYHIRVLVRLDERSTLVDQACHLVVLAEIISRWPAAQRALLSRHPEGHGLEVLAKAADDDWTWARAVRQLGLNTAEHRSCTNGVRDLLRRYDGKSIATLAARLT